MAAKMVLLLLFTQVSVQTIFAQEIKCPEGAQLTNSDPTESTCKRIGKDGSYIPHGPSVERFTNGAKHKSGAYQNGKKTGLWTWWYPNGKKMQEAHYKNDRFIGGTLRQWDENGNLLVGGSNSLESFAGSVKKNLTDKKEN